MKMGDVYMARKSKSVYERIEETRSEISLKEQELVQLKSLLEELLQEKDDLEMRQAWAAIKDSGLTIEDVQKMLERQTK